MNDNGYFVMDDGTKSTDPQHQKRKSKIGKARKMTKEQSKGKIKRDSEIDESRKKKK